jgi:hypothetical protein
MDGIPEIFLGNTDEKNRHRVLVCGELHATGDAFPLGNSPRLRIGPPPLPGWGIDDLAPLLTYTRRLIQWLVPVVLILS